MNDSIIIHVNTDTLSPCGARILVHPDPVEEKTAGGIYRPDTAQTRTQRGTIIAVGPEVKRLQVGQRVMFTYWSAAHLSLNGVEHFIYDEKDVLGVLITEDAGDKR